MPEERARTKMDSCIPHHMPTHLCTEALRWADKRTCAATAMEEEKLERYPFKDIDLGYRNLRRSRAIFSAKNSSLVGLNI